MAAIVRRMPGLGCGCVRMCFLFRFRPGTALLAPTFHDYKILRCRKSCGCQKIHFTKDPDQKTIHSAAKLPHKAFQAPLAKLFLGLL
jgi:hypothetical protein